jgi:hypothetical protein
MPNLCIKDMEPGKFYELVSGPSANQVGRIAIGWRHQLDERVHGNYLMRGFTVWPPENAGTLWVCSPPTAAPKELRYNLQWVVREL